MKRILIISVAIIFSVSACSGDTPLSPDINDTSNLKAMHRSGNTGLPGKGTVLRLVGTAVARQGKVMDIDGDGQEDDALCFEVDLLDAGGKKIGTAIDCLSAITPVGDGMALVGTTIFNLPNGTFIARGYTTVQPLTTTVPSPATHTTGAVPMPGARMSKRIKNMYVPSSQIARTRTLDSKRIDPGSAKGARLHSARSWVRLSLPRMLVRSRHQLPGPHRPRRERATAPGSRAANSE